MHAGHNVGSLDVVWNMMLCIRPGPPLSWRYDIARGMHDAQLRLDAHAKNLLSRCDYQKFWQGIKKDGCCKSQKYANRVDNAVGDTDICAMWKEPFKSLYNSVPDNGVKETVLGMI